jgi:murein DD-endopeptidase MepM/ murein hydrolase activator NlpD
MAISSSLLSSANNIVKLNRSTSGLNRGKASFSNFLRFMEVQTKGLESIKFNEKKLKKALSANVTASFGRSGNLLSGLASGALDAASFVGDFFGGNRKVKPNTPAGKPIPKGPRIKFGGIRALGIANAVFAGLDFATGLAEGESVGKAAAGAGGALAGSLLGGAIGQALIPIPGVGFMVGSALGGMAGGWVGDRAYETGEGIAKEKTERKLKEQEVKQKQQAAIATQVTISDVMSKFDSVVYKFEEVVGRGLLGPTTGDYEGTNDEESDEKPLEPETPELVNNNQQTGETGDYSVSGGSLPSSKRGSPYGNRWGRKHYGIDYPVNVGTPISVIQPGTVAFSGLDSGGNLSVYIDHTDGSHTRYLHLSRASVSQGQKIEPGTLIGYSGGAEGAYGSGNSTGPHLHYEYAPAGSGSVDPAAGNNDDKYFRFGGNVQVKPKVTSQTGVMGQSGRPTAVLMAGTNDYGSPQSGAAGVKQAIKALQDKGYNVVVVPPSEVGQTAEVSKQVQEVAKQMGATVRKGQYMQKDNSGAIPYAHLTKDSADAIAKEYKGATFVGDSNAQKIPGAKIAIPSMRASGIAAEINKQISSAGPAVQPQPQSQIQSVPQQSTTPQQVQQYPSYATVQQSVVLMPISQGQQAPVVISSGSGGSQTVVMPSTPQSAVLNNLMKTMLLTNLSGT